MDELTNEDILRLKKKFLIRYKNTYFCIRRLQEKVDALELRIISTKSPSFSNEPHSTIKYTTEDVIAEKVDTENRIVKLQHKANRYKQEIYNVIDTIERPIYVEVLELLYIECMSLDRASSKMRYSSSRFKTLYRQSLDAIDVNDIMLDVVH